MRRGEFQEAIYELGGQPVSFIVRKVSFSAWEITRIEQLRSCLRDGLINPDKETDDYAESTTGSQVFRQRIFSLN